MFLGVAVGFSEGIAARSLGKFSYGTLGGAIGGFIGGMLFGLALEKANATGGHASLWGAIGLIILGACIGSLSALVQSVFQPASVKVLRGWQEGREYPLDKIDNLLGRDEHADIALFRDMKVEKQHAIIQREGQRYLLLNNEAPSEWTRVNDRPVLQCCDLHDGDRIQLGKVILRFQRARPAENVKAEDRDQLVRHEHESRNTEETGAPAADQRSCPPRVLFEFSSSAVRHLAVQLCPRCQRANPRDAAFCYFDGVVLQQGIAGAASPATAAA